MIREIVASGYANIEPSLAETEGAVPQLSKAEGT